MENSQPPQTTEILKEFLHLPKFPDRRIDYTNSPKAPVITCFVRYGDDFLLLKRGDKVATHKGRWSVVAGYLDDFNGLKEKVLEELREEIGVLEKDIKSIKFGDVYIFTDSETGKTWVVHPALVELSKKPEIKLDWEHTEFRWVKIGEIKNFDVPKDLEDSLERLIK